MKITIEGYKSIADARSIEIGGLTILAGANSSGKSSFMQPLLLMKQSIENEFDSGSLLLDGANVRLTDSSEIISKVPGSNSNFFSVSLDSGEEKIKASYKFNVKRGITIDKLSMSGGDFRDGSEIRLGMKSNDIETILELEKFTPFKKIMDNLEGLTWKVARDRCFLGIRLHSSKRFPFSAGVLPAERLKKLTSDMIHVPGLRGNPERSYKVASSDSKFPGSFERYVASIIYRWKNTRSAHKKFESLVSQLKELGLATSINVSIINDTKLEILISRHKGCVKAKHDYVNIADVGFGVSQTLPVLVALLTAKKGQVVYIEQPELHLHPRAQYELSKIIAQAVKEGVNVIIETHSSILIRGIQILVAKNQLKGEQVNLNWFVQDAQTGQTQITKSKLDKFGAFGDWPEDFDSIALDVEQEYLDAVEEAATNEN